MLHGVPDIRGTIHVFEFDGSTWVETDQIHNTTESFDHLGAKLELTEDSVLNVEYQYSSDASALGISLVLPY